MQDRQACLFLPEATRAVQEQVVESPEADKRRAFYLSLQSSGLVKRIKPRPTIDPPRRTLFQVQGPLVSQTIIEERR